ncbi:MAG: InlB B-repeat-containing protein [Oscillospiraceae bacterium]|nr:InlB B-repeat-containing protein [Oscillospiraceae bacterium]
MKKHSRINRILSGILAFVTLLSLMPLQAWGTESVTKEPVSVSESASPRITRAGVKTQAIRLAAHERIEINAEGSADNAVFQWQIAHPEKEAVWINIYDATHGYLFVTLALVRNMMTDDNIARLRCRVTEGEQVRYTDPVTVQFCPEIPYIPETTPETEPIVETLPPVEILSPTEPETTAPAETVSPTEPETTAPAETAAPTEPETTAPAETVAPTVPETTAPAETVAPTVPETTAPAETAAPTMPETTAPAETVAPTVPETTAPAETLAPFVPETQPLTAEKTDAARLAKQLEAAAPAETAPAETTAPAVPETTAPAQTVPTVVTQDTAAAEAAAADPVDPENSEFVTVRIDYVRYDFYRDAAFKLVPEPQNPEGWENPVYHGGYLLDNDGHVAFTSYVATLQSGTDLNATVPIPTIVGYDTYLNGVKVTAVQINQTNITENIEYTVEYRPAQVSYTIRYYFQNIYDDLYVEDTSQKQTAQGFTGSVPPDDQLRKEFPGFLSLYYQPDSIAADGSTVFEVYYERNYYLMEFDCNGGYGTETLYNRYGSYINVPDPVLAGYVFGGWDLASTEESGQKVDTEDGTKDNLPTEMPRYNTAYKAIWNTDTTFYTVVYWCENADDDEYSFWGSEEIRTHGNGTPVKSNDRVSATDHTKVSYADSEYFTYDPATTIAIEAARKDLVDGKVVVEGDGSTVVNVYFSRNEYSFRFYYARKNGDYYQIATHTGDFSNSKKLEDATWSDSLPTIPTLNAAYETANKAGQATSGAVQHDDGCTYYYIAMTAKYNADLIEKWPAAWINDSENKKKFVSWATQFGSGYYINNENKNIKGTYQRLDEDLIIDPAVTKDVGLNHVFVAYWSGNPTTYKYNIYYEMLPGDVADTTKDGIDYKLIKTDIVLSTASVGEQSPLSYEGAYKALGPEDAEKGDGTTDSPKEVDFYYKRYIYHLKFYNHNAYLQSGDGAEIKFGRPLSIYGDYVNKQVMESTYYPAGLEPGAYEFVGWYTSSGCFEGTEMDWTSTMPSNELTVYAKWAPIKRDVLFFAFYDDIAKLEAAYDTTDGSGDGITNYIAGRKNNTILAKPDQIPFQEAFDTPHGEILGSIYNKIPTAADDPRVEGYRFIGWFYMDEDNKKRFAPDSMEVTRDLVLFAEWSTELDTTYEVRYVLAEDYRVNDTETLYPKGTEIADMTFAHSSVGKTKTFNAKAMGELYPAFQESFFPVTNTHSILMKEDPAENTFVFEYMYDDTVYYKVRYLDAVTRAPIPGLAEKVTSTNKAVVTEKFKPAVGYIPQNYYIRKTLAYDANATADNVLEENTITFYYVKDTEHGMYSIEYYLENADSTDSGNRDNYTQYESIVGAADLGEPITADVRSYEGYTHVPELNTVITYKSDGEVDEETVNAEDPPGGTVTVNGLTIQLYYKRNSYPYVIEYREYGAAETAPALKTLTDESSKAVFGAQVPYTLTTDTEYNRDSNTIVINGNTYVYYIENPTDADLTKSMTIRAFNPGEENPNKLIFYFVPKKVEVHYDVAYRNAHEGMPELCRVSMASESAATAANLSGASAMPAEGFRFVGWYLDEEGKNPVESDWVTTDGSYQKLKPKTLDTTMDEVHYYALFEPVDLKVIYEENGGVKIPDDTAHIGETITLPSTTRTGYTLTGWWYDADGDGNVDEGEEYAPGADFTMPGKNVTLTAQWIDYRFDKSHKVFVGLNMSFYKSGDQYYYKFPPGEPTIVTLEAARAYIASIGADGKNTWAVQENGWNNALCKPGVLGVPAEPKDYIDPAILNQVTTNGDVIGVFDEDGGDTKALLYFTENDYNAIIEAWLGARDYFEDHFSHYNINWEELPKPDPAKGEKASDLYEAVPYVIKRHHHGLTGNKDWFIDFVILPINRFKVTYNLNLPEGYEDTAPVDENLYGQGMYVDVADFHDVPCKADERYVAKFVGWTAADKDGNPVAIDSNTNKFTMPGSDVTLTAQWEYRAPLTIAQTGMKDNESAIYRVTGNGVDLTVSITGNNKVTVLDLPLGDYTVTEQTSWSWAYDNQSPVSQKVTLTNQPGQPHPALVTFTNRPMTESEYKWLHGENHKDNHFSAIS